MIESKVFELRDSATFVPIVATRMEVFEPRGPGTVEQREAWLLRRAGYAPNTGLVLLSRLDGGRCSYDPYEWGGRTFPVAHKHIAENWDALLSGDLIDVRVVLGESDTPAQTEQETA